MAFTFLYSSHWSSFHSGALGEQIVHLYTGDVLLYSSFFLSLLEESVSSLHIEFFFPVASTSCWKVKINERSRHLWQQHGAANYFVWEIYLTSLTFSDLQQFTQSFNIINVDFLSEEKMQTCFTTALWLVDLGIFYNVQEQSWSEVADLIYRQITYNKKWLFFSCRFYETWCKNDKPSIVHCYYGNPCALVILTRQNRLWRQIWHWEYEGNN